MLHNICLSCLCSYSGSISLSVVLVCRSLADTQRTGKLTKEQFCLAMHLIQEKVKGVDPPQSLTPDMIPPSERGATSTPVSGQNAHMHPLTLHVYESKAASLQPQALLICYNNIFLTLTKAAFPFQIAQIENTPNFTKSPIYFKKVFTLS